MSVASSTQTSSAIDTVSLSSDKDPSTDCLEIQLTGKNEKVYTVRSKSTDNELKCPVCFFLSYPPVIVCQRGHTMCENCAIKLKERRLKCPVDRGQLLNQFIPNRLMKNIIRGLSYEEPEGIGVSISELFENTVIPAERSPHNRQRFESEARLLTVEQERIQASLGSEPVDIEEDFEDNIDTILSQSLVNEPRESLQLHRLPDPPPDQDTVSEEIERIWGRFFSN